MPAAEVPEPPTARLTETGRERNQNRAWMVVDTQGPCVTQQALPRTAISSPEASDALQMYRQDAWLNGAVTLGMNCITVDGVGSILRVGQAVSVELDLG